MSPVCKAGHVSSEPDYCSVCGAPISAGAAGAPGGAALLSSSGELCPACGEPRAPGGARFCEVCRFDFVARAPGPPPGASEAVDLAATMMVAAPGASRARAAAGPSAEAGPIRRWQLWVTADPALDVDPDPATPCPTGEPPLVFDVEGAEVLVGRRDPRRDIHPEVPLGDPGASRRHAKFLRNADGSIALQDLASVNGTSVNGVELLPGTRWQLAEGDEVTLGRWTRIVLRGVR